jgi:hypothetical protein
MRAMTMSWESIVVAVVRCYSSFLAFEPLAFADSGSIGILLMATLMSDSMVVVVADDVVTMMSTMAESTLILPPILP